MSAIVETEIKLVNEIGRTVRADLRVPPGTGRVATILVLPGFKGFKDWGMFPPAARLWTEQGFATVTINTSRNGIGDSREEFTDLEGFAKNTPGREKLDVELVAAALRRGDLDARLDPERLGILGHSRGGGVALLVAAQDPRIRCIVTWGSIAKFLRYTDRAIREWRQSGRLEVPNMRTGQMMWLDREVLDDFETHRAEYDLQQACRKIAAPALFIHGERDESVDADDSRQLYEWCGSREKKLEIIPKTGHTFGAVHPWAGATPGWEAACRLSGEWFARWLS
ncbi:MAG TPA: alpha/beta fold hydrolase [bacterium]|nr:alpha/beta fold hydrolase [bacterium]